MSEKSVSEIAELNLRLEAARRAYYSGDPTGIMSDAKYDRLEQRLAALVHRHPEEAPVATVLTTVGSDLTTRVTAPAEPPADPRLVSASGARIPHAHPMRSIENKYSVEDVVQWAESLGWPMLTLSGKFDGISCSLTYERGLLTKAVTRGDGESGESILAQVGAVSHIPKKLGVPVDLEVRGELVIRRSRMLELNKEIEATGGKPYISTRNLVAGTMKLHDLAEVAKRQVNFLPWEVLSAILDNPDSGGDSARERLSTLVDLGFEVPPIHECNGRAELEDMLPQFIESHLNEKEPEIGMDGIVIKVDSCTLRRKLGYGTKFANYQVCFKAQNARAESVLREVVWQVGRHGRLTPVGIVDPVFLAGAEVRRATLNNINFIRDLGLKIGSRVMVTRSGDVIPQITEVLDD